MFQSVTKSLAIGNVASPEELKEICQKKDLIFNHECFISKEKL